MKFNHRKSSPTPAQNRAGGSAYEYDDPRERLRAVTLNNLLEPMYYREDAEAVDDLLAAVDACAAGDPEFVLQCAAWARQEAYVRDVPQLLLATACHNDDLRPYVRPYAPQIIARADELATVLAMSNWLQTGDAGDFAGASVPYVLKRALADVIESGRFDTYQFAKYRQANRAVSLHDVINVAHPAPTDPEVAEAIERLVKGERDAYPDVEPLRQRRTWEDRLSAAGQERPDGPSAEDWYAVLDDMGLFALIRNLRNMLEAGVNPREIRAVLDIDWVRNSQLYPFRFYQAQKALRESAYGRQAPEIHDWLAQAIDVAAENIPAELTDTVVCVDLSGSMQTPLSANSSITYAEIASLFGAMLGVRGADVIGFGETVAHCDGERLRGRSVLATQRTIGGLDVGHSTNAHRALARAGDAAPGRARVVVFTDLQIWNDQSPGLSYGLDANAFRAAWEDYRRAAPGAHLYMADLASYGQPKLPPNYESATAIQGWSAKLLDFLYHNEYSLLADIESTEPAADVDNSV